MSCPETGPAPIPVHVTGVSAEVSLGAGAPAAPARPRLRTEFTSESVDDANPVRPLLPDKTSRVIAWVQATGGDVLLCDTEVNARQGIGSPLPSANTAPWPLGGTQAVWIAQKTAGNTCTVSCTADYET